MSGPLEFTFKGQSAFVLGAPVSHSHGSFRRAVRALSERRVQASEAGWSGRRAQGPSCTFGIELRYSTFENAPPDSTAVAATVANPNAPRLCSLRMFERIRSREMFRGRSSAIESLQSSNSSSLPALRGKAPRTFAHRPPAGEGFRARVGTGEPAQGTLWEVHLLLNRSAVPNFRRVGGREFLGFCNSGTGFDKLVHKTK